MYGFGLSLLFSAYLLITENAPQFVYESWSEFLYWWYLLTSCLIVPLAFFLAVGMTLSIPAIKMAVIKAGAPMPSFEKISFGRIFGNVLLNRALLVIGAALLYDSAANNIALGIGAVALAIGIWRGRKSRFCSGTRSPRT
ncbi:MAG: hypothetical protein Q8Q39_03245 [bacterium]|nr:hypothetical protein [bacterium]